MSLKSERPSENCKNGLEESLSQRKLSLISKASHYSNDRIHISSRSPRHQILSRKTMTCNYCMIENPYCVHEK